MRQQLFEELALRPGDVFVLRSRSRQAEYEMLVGPDGDVVHQGEGCEGEIFNGPLGCWHSKDAGRNVSMTQALQTYEAPPVPAVQFTREDLDTLKATIAKGTTDSELKLFVATCQRTGLDPFARQIYCIKRRTYNSQTKSYDEVMTVQVGIDGLRLIAERTGLYAGIEGPQWSADGKEWLDAWYLEGNPKFARVAIYRKDLARPFMAVARWDAYVQQSREGAPAGLWGKMGPEQLAKCAEALAFRRAFPNQMTGIAASIDSDYDPDADEEELRQSEPQHALSQGAIEGEYADVSDEHEDPQPKELPPTVSTDVQSPVHGQRSAPSAGASPETAAPNATPAQLLSQIERAQGRDAKVDAINVMTRLYGTAMVTKLSPDDARDYLGILRVRLDAIEHEHALAYTAFATPVCSVCGDEMDEPETEQAQQGALPT